MKDQIDSLFSREMTRKEFLQQVGSGMLIVFGISGLINAFQPKPHSNDKQPTFGYGGSEYGGNRR